MIFIGGGLGSMSRYAIWRLLEKFHFQLPFATFAANMLSCLILGYFVGTQLKLDVSDNLRLLLLVGFCGGFSTFSTFGFEAYQMLQSGNYGTAISYILVSMVICWVFIFLGIKLA